MNIADYTIAITIVPHGYEINLLNHKKVLDGKFAPEHTECRSFGEDINVEKLSNDLIGLIRNGDKDLPK
jgi:hypothetical protein